MEIGVFETAEQVAQAAFEFLTAELTKAENKVVGVATGSTPDPLYALLRDAHAQGSFSLSDFQAFALDEYVGIDVEHPERYRNVLRANLVGDDKTGLLDANLHTPDGNATDPEQAAFDYDAAIKASGGVAVQILGIGADGHIGFNEPGGSLNSRTHVDALTAQTRIDNARFFDGDLNLVPQKCITQGLGTIMDAEKILLLATGENKAEAIRELLEGAVSARWPATILQFHSHVTVIVDDAAASKLELRDFYAQRWEAAH